MLGGFQNDVTTNVLEDKVGMLGTLTPQICLDDPRVNLMVRRSLRIWICTQSLDFFLGQTVDVCDLPVAQLV
jgi:hypothetical protein